MDRKPRQFDRFPFENKQKSLEKISFLKNTVDKFHGGYLYTRMRNLPCYLNWQGAVDLTCRIRAIV